MRMIEVVDLGDYGSLTQLAQALQADYRDQLGEIPARMDDDGFEEAADPLA